LIGAGPSRIGPKPQAVESVAPIDLAPCDAADPGDSAWYASASLPAKPSDRADPTGSPDQASSPTNPIPDEAQQAQSGEDESRRLGCERWVREVRAEAEIDLS
jgi:hypothetical protein